MPGLQLSVVQTFGTVTRLSTAIGLSGRGAILGGGGGDACFRRGGGGGGLSKTQGIQGFVCQKWPNHLFPLQNLIFYLDGFWTDLEGGGGGVSFLPFSDSSKGWGEGGGGGVHLFGIGTDQRQHVVLELAQKSARELEVGDPQVADAREAFLNALEHSGPGVDVKEPACTTVGPS